MEKIFELELPWPPSINMYWRRNGGRYFISAQGTKYRHDVMWLAGKRTPILEPISVVIIATMPDNRKRDLDNILKALLDSLAHAGVYLDDSQIHDLHIKRLGVKKPGALLVSIARL